MKENDNIFIYLENLRVFANFRDVRDKQLLDNDANIKINVIDIFCKMFHDDFIWIQYYLDISKNWGQIFDNSKYSSFSDNKSNVWLNVKLNKMCLRIIQF